MTDAPKTTAAGLVIIAATLTLGIAVGAMFGVWICKGITSAACVATGGVC